MDSDLNPVEISDITPDFGETMTYNLNIEKYTDYFAENVLVHNKAKWSGTYDLVSVAKHDPLLLKHARMIQGTRDSTDMNNLISVVIHGGNPGLGNLPVPGTSGVIEARARNGARLYFLQNDIEHKITIVGYSIKPDQTAVIKRLRELYPKK